MVNHLDDNILFLMKFGKKQHMEALWEKGELFFSPPTQFTQKGNNSDGQYDKWDSHQNVLATHLMYYPLLDEKTKQPQYGAGKKFVDNAIVHTIPNKTKKIPMTCFRIVTDEDIDSNNRFQFSDGDLQKIKTEFPDYDTFILMPAIWLIDAICRNSEKYDICFEKIEYGYGETSDSLPEHLKMFNKLERYSYQKEFRFILPNEQFDSGKIIHIPPIKSGAIIGNIEQLKLGYVFAKSKDELVQNIKTGALDYK